MASISFINRPPQRVAIVEHKGSFDQINTAMDELKERAKASTATQWDGGIYAIYYSDPAFTPEAELVSAAAIALKEGEEIEGLETRIIAGGRYAVLGFVGPYEKLPEGWKYMVREGFGRLPIRFDQPKLEIYVSDPEETPAEQCLTLLAVPVL